MTNNDKEILRELARKVAELAARPIETEKRELWYKHNALEVTRPLIFCDPENGWKEIIRKDQLECESELGRSWEFQLRKEIFWGDKMGDDRVIEPVFTIYYMYHDTGWGLDIIDKKVPEGGAYKWDAPLKDYSDFDKLKFPELIIDLRAQVQASVTLKAARESIFTIISIVIYPIPYS